MVASVPSPKALIKKHIRFASFLYRELGRRPAPEVSVVDVTGAGDVVAGTFLASIVSDRSAEESLVAAVQAASQSITKEGIEHILHAPRESLEQ